MACLGEDAKEWVHAYPPSSALSESVLVNLTKLQQALCTTPTTATATANEGLSNEEEKEVMGGAVGTAITPFPPMQHLVR